MRASRECAFEWHFRQELVLTLAVCGSWQLVHSILPLDFRKHADCISR